MRTNWMSRMAMAGLGLVAFAGIGRAGDDIPGPIDSLSDLQDAGKMAFKLADMNNDGQISQKEAVDAGNLIVGGFFFRADANGDGALSKEELQAARNDVMNQYPLLRLFVQRNAGAIQPTPGSPAATAAASFSTLLDANNDGQLQASELRNMVQTSVTALYATADTNRDGQMSPTEVNAAIAGMIKAAGQAAFAAADTDRDGQISLAEYDKAIIEPANAIFRAMDINNDGQISPQEAQAARQAIMSQLNMLRVPEPANSARNLLRSGRTPEQVAPVPNFGNPALPGAAPTPAVPR